MRGRSHKRVVFLLRGAIALAVLMLRPLTAGAAPILLGDSVQGALFSNTGDVPTQFTPSAVVGAGVEFTGTVFDGGRRPEQFDVSVDIGASGFTIGWTSPEPDDNLGASAVIIGLSLTGLDFTPGGIITGVTRTGYICTPAGSFACSTGGPDVPTVNFTDNSITLGFQSVRAGETYTFDIAVAESNPVPVPEPTSLALLGTGLATFIAGRRRRGARP